jgi:DNA replication protein DnaC
MTDTPQVLLAHHLKALKLPTILREYDKIARQCAAEGVDYPRYLLRLVEAEIIERDRRMVDRRIKAAKFPTVKSLDSFDFAAFPDLNKALVMELARSEYVERRENIIAVGNSESDSYCSSLDLLKTPALFDADCQTTDAEAGGPALLG